MSYVKENVMARPNILVVARFLGLAIVATGLPFFIHIQWISGPIVNALLIVALFVVGIRTAFLLCLIPSLMALAGGLLPPVLAPVVPFIMISNVLFVFTIDYFYQKAKNADKGYWLGVCFGAGLKYLFLFLNVKLMASLVLRKDLAVAVTTMMSWPQLATALAGGVLAFVFLKWLKRI